MGFLKLLRSKLPRSSDDEPHAIPKPAGPDRLSLLPKSVLTLIFSHVSPHSMDTSLEPNEKSMIPGYCGLCGLKDLHSCALLNRRCYMVLQDVLYRCVRIDAVHFCSRELELAELRQKKHVDPSDVVPTRIRLLQRTAWARPDIAAGVHFLKLPYMAREAFPADLARTIAALPNLRHIDLPEAFYAASSRLHILREEVMAKCWDLRRTKFAAGAELDFESLINRRLWTRLETLELSKLDVDVAVLRRVFETFACLQHVRLLDLPCLDDSLFRSAPGVPDFPAVATLEIKSSPGITSFGLAEYISRPTVAHRLLSLTLNETGATVYSLPGVLALTTSLKYLSLIDSVVASFPVDEIPPLSSSSIEILNYEITSARGSSQHPRRATSLEKPYYEYLAQSLVGNSLPSLQKLYVRDADFVATLTASRPGTHDPSRALLPLARTRGVPLMQPIEVFSKGEEDTDWIVDSVGTCARSMTQGMSPLQGRRVSAYAATRGSGVQWGGQARKSVVVSNGAGGFLALPTENDDDASAVPILSKAWEDSKTHGTLRYV